MSTLTPQNLRCEYLKDPRGLTVKQPRLSWIVTSDARAQVQSAYHILVAATPEDLATDQGTLWDSGIVQSDATTHISYAGRPLTSGQRAYWKARVWDGNGNPSDFSEAATWQMGLLNADDWHAQWIGLNPAPEPELGMRPVTTLRRAFSVDKPIAQATLYATAKGIYIPSLNGERIGDLELAPGWTDYTKRFQVQTYDVTDTVQVGENALGIALAEGWYSGYVGFQGMHNTYGDFTRALAQLVITHTDGTRTLIATDADWQATTDGPVRYGDIQMGEYYDARQTLPGWDTTSFDASAWQSVIVEERNPAIALIGQPNPPMKIMEDVKPVSVKEHSPGVWIFDLGQNIAGHITLNITSATEGDIIRIRYGEMLEPDGSLHTANLRSARATDTYICKNGTAVYEPTFTYHGFRYVELTGLPETPDLNTVTGRVLYNAMDASGTFECSHPKVNQLWRNIVWGQKGNFISIPTDCPQRDERLGWSGDAQIFCRTASFNMDVAAFFTKWMDDYTDAQTPEGAFTDIAPNIGGMGPGAPAWGDAGIIIPWTLWQVYGDTRLIEKHWGAMVRWMSYIADANPRYLRTKRLHNNYSDWVALERGSSAEQMATAYWAKTARMMSEMAETIDLKAEAVTYSDLFDNIKQAYIAAYVNADGFIETGTQAAYVLALDNDLLPENLHAAAAKRLVAKINGPHRGHLATGFLGTPPLCFVLAENGYLDVAYQLLNNETYPSWLYMINNGATTMWERWNAYTHESGIHDPGMNSFNHYAYGAIAEWMYRVIAGINAGAPGYKHSVLSPHPGGGYDYAKASYDSLHGRIESAWRVEDDGVHYDFTIPANTTATVKLSTENPHTIREGNELASEAKGITYLKYEQGVAVFEVKSGTYHFVVA